MNEIANNIKVLHTFNTPFNADSVEWCPHEPHQNVFVCANYQLKQSTDGTPAKRYGKILLFTVSFTDLTLLQEIDTPAVLDQKWCHNQIGGKSVLGVVNAENGVEVFRLEQENSLVRICGVKIGSSAPELLILSLDWSTGKYSSEGPNIVCSDSQGDLHLLTYYKEVLTLEKSWHAHDFEAWIAGFYYWDKNVVFSGGDDSLFLKYDLRIGSEPIFKNRVHEAGVTCMHSNSKKEFMFVTGSYDSNVRLWDIRKLKTPLDTQKLEGTLWRLKWDPFDHSYILAASMLGGAHVLHKTSSDELEISSSLYEHKNIVYGADWCFLNEEVTRQYPKEGNVLIGTCSFYDNLLCISKVTCNKNIGKYSVLRLIPFPILWYQMTKRYETSLIQIHI